MWKYRYLGLHRGSFSTENDRGRKLYTVTVLSNVCECTAITIEQQKRA
jgi:hypothetical protein